MSIAFGRPIVADPEAGVFLFADARRAPPAPLADFDPVEFFKLCPSPIVWPPETLAERLGRRARARRQRKTIGWAK